MAQDDEDLPPWLSGLRGQDATPPALDWDTVEPEPPSESGWFIFPPPSLGRQNDDNTTVYSQPAPQTAEPPKVDSRYPVAGQGNTYTPRHRRYVYVMLADDGLCKIGISNCPSERAKVVRYEYEKKTIEVIMAREFNLAGYYERVLHAMFKHKHVEGEWFNLDETDLMYLRNFLTE